MKRLRHWLTGLWQRLTRGKPSPQAGYIAVSEDGETGIEEAE